MSKKIAYLHLHSEYSLLDSMLKIEKMVDKASDNGIDAVAITDPYFFGHVKFYSKMLEKSLLPILGLEMETKDGQFIVLCENKQGYLDLIRLWNNTLLFEEKPSIETLLESLDYFRNVTVLSGHPEKSILRRIEKDQKSSIFIEKLKALTKTGKFYIQLLIPSQTDNLKNDLKIAQEFKIPIVGTYNTMYLGKEEGKLFGIFNKLNGKTKSSSVCEFKSRKDFLNDFENFPEIFESFEQIIERVEVYNLRTDFDFPSFSQDDKVILKKKVLDSLAEKYGIPLPKRVRERVNKELNIIFSRNLESYFLTVKEIIDIASKLGIMVGPGRGSVVGSVVAYALRITAIDPLKHGLIFERFLNESRNDLPDIDIDVQDSKRQELLFELKKHFGNDRFSQIIAFGTYGLKLLKHEIHRNLEGEDQRYALENITKLVGFPHHTSTHAAGIILSKMNLVDKLPLLKGEIGNLTQFDMEDLEKIGIAKIDILGLRTLTTIKETIEESGEKFEDFSYERIPLNDTETFRLISQGFTSGVFQLESRNARNICVKVAPQKFEDITMLLALNRPGPMISGMLDLYSKRKKTFRNCRINEILDETEGLLLYQEQIMRIVSEFAGLSLAKADEFRRAIAKKDPEKIKEYKQEFIEGAAKRGITLKDAEYIFEKIEDFASYAFNKSHSVAYALLTYITAFLKSRMFPVYLKILLNSNLGDREKVSTIISESKLMDSKTRILKVAINKSYDLCSIEDGNVRIGLSFIKGFSSQKVKKIIIERENFGKFEDVESTIMRLKQFLDDRDILKLIKAGALDELDGSRIRILEKFKILQYKQKNELKQIQAQVFGLKKESGIKKNTSFENTTMMNNNKFMKILYELETFDFIISNDVENEISVRFKDYRPKMFELLYILDEGFCPVVVLNSNDGSKIITDGTSFIKLNKKNLENGKIYIAYFKGGKLIDILDEHSKELKYEYIVHYENEKKLDEILKDIEKSENSELVIYLKDHLIRIEDCRPKVKEGIKVRINHR